MAASAVDSLTERQAPKAPSSRSGRFGSLAEFLVTGGLTPVLFLVSLAIQRAFALDVAEYEISFAAFYAAYVINDPHFAVTYFLFYRGFTRRAFGTELPRAMRLRYLLAGVVTPAVLGSWAVLALALRAPPALGWMVQLMYALVGWHYVKQGFGVLTVLSARRGVRLTDRERWAVLAHCFAGWAFAWSNPATPALDYEEKGLVYRAIAHPRWLELTSGVALVLSTIGLAVVLVARFRREGKFLPFAPLFGLLVTIWSWTIFSNVDPLLRYWIPALHSIQYLYFVWLLKRNEARAEEGPPSFGRPVAVRLGALALGALILGWVLFHGGPTYLDSMRSPENTKMFGDTPFFAALFVIVNVHHYVMDHVIWRRENPDTRYLRDISATPRRGSSSRGSRGSALDAVTRTGEGKAFRGPSQRLI